MTDKGGDGWVVSDGAAFTLITDNAADASAALRLAREHTVHCTIGPRDLPASGLGRRATRWDYWK
jgi:hypothetical protein